ncbi:hypothetical protein A2W24_07035 [Microgenomates group bacterium RBG_16_45_19]|nr:MAG: hypothetical protein A2W24_07035 [Microgenomates group bacterium RBG_16_45_19]
MPAGVPAPIKTNPIGQFKDEAVEVGKQIAKDTLSGVKSVVSPKQILESILGQTQATQAGESLGVETLSGAKQPTDPAQQAKVAEDRSKAEALLRLHRQRLQEQEVFIKEKEQAEEMKKQQAKAEEEQQQQQQIVQLKHEQQKEDVLGSMIKQFEGSKEMKAWGAG